MNKTIKKIACAALCAVLLFCMAVPAFAITGYEVKDQNLNYIGVRARCTSALNTSAAIGTLSLSYLPAYSTNYLPEEDYSTKVGLSVHYAIGFSITPDDVTGGMQATNSFDHPTTQYGTLICDAATFTYTVNSSWSYQKTF